MSSTTKDDGPNAASHRTMHEDNGDKPPRGHGRTRTKSFADDADLKRAAIPRGSSRTRTASIVMDADLKHEEGGPDVTMADAKPTYKSWKKKYRKMRIKFDESMAQGEQLYQQEQKALKKIKQLAIYNEQASLSRPRLLDLLTDINNRPQIPTEKRFDVSLDIPSDAEETFTLDIDREARAGPQPSKSLKDLIKDVPHLDFAATAERYPDVANNLLTGIDSPAAEASHQQHPPSFLTADDIDNYLWEVDTQAKAESEEHGDEMEMLPTLAPLAREHNAGGGHIASAAGRGATPSSAATNLKDTSAAGASSISTTSRDFALRNPTSVYNWLRKHAPNTFLQDNDGGEEKKQKGGGGDKKSRKAHRMVDEDEEEDEDDNNNTTTTTRTPARKGAGGGGGGARKSGAEGGRANTAAARAKGERASRRSTAASAKSKRQSMDETMYDVDDEMAVEAAAAVPHPPAGAGSKSKRKRAVVDDDTGYRPKGGSSRRPTKKRNKNSISAASVGGAGAADHGQGGALGGGGGGAETPSGKKKAVREGAVEAREAKEDAEGETED
ncbi:hypothetical protein VMCG_09134 [Cytospora schulzeri]|uniref:Uncharacterized protein n=1 Tax=Cytospora schulzeri TaxID=448051 RepID=A0A423VMZ6_9PEZI|nr:hypothetical protein VMCG_09134 [Valsa malicola]